MSADNDNAKVPEPDLLALSVEVEFPESVVDVDESEPVEVESVESSVLVMDIPLMSSRFSDWD